MRSSQCQVRGTLSSGNRVTAECLWHWRVSHGCDTLLSFTLSPLHQCFGIFSPHCNIDFLLTSHFPDFCSQCPRQENVTDLNTSVYVQALSLPHSIHRGKLTDLEHYCWNREYLPQGIFHLDGTFEYFIYCRLLRVSFNSVSFKKYLELF